MPRRRIGVQSALTVTSNGLVKKLAEELKNDRDYGQPLVYEQEYATKKSRVTVIWDGWANARRWRNGLRLFCEHMNWPRVEMPVTRLLSPAV